MGFEFPAANKLRDCAVKNKRVEEIDVIRNEKAGLVRIEAGLADDADSGSGEKHDTAAESTLQPVVFFGVEHDGERDQARDCDGEMQEADEPEQGASNHIPDALHIKTSKADGMTSSSLHLSERISPSIMTSTGTVMSNSTRRTDLRDASGWWMCVPS